MHDAAHHMPGRYAAGSYASCGCVGGICTSSLPHTILALSGTYCKAAAAATQRQRRQQQRWRQAQPMSQSIHQAQCTVANTLLLTSGGRVSEVKQQAQADCLHNLHRWFCPFPNLCFDVISIQQAPPKQSPHPSVTTSWLCCNNFRFVRFLQLNANTPPAGSRSDRAPSTQSTAQQGTATATAHVETIQHCPVGVNNNTVPATPATSRSCRAPSKTEGSPTSLRSCHCSHTLLQSANVWST
jgi:hypothetical protein